MLLRTINSSRPASCYRTSVVKLDTEQKLIHIESDNQKWFSLRRASRYLNNLRHEPASKSLQSQPCVLEEVGFKFNLSYPYSEAPSIQIHSLDEFFSNSTQLYTPEHSFPHLMKYSTICFVVDGSFYPESSSLISEAWRCSLDEKLLVIGSFVSSVAL